MKLNYEAGKVPTKYELRAGEVAYNVPDGIQYTKLDDESIIVLSRDAAAGSGHKNLLINGGFNVWQRGSTFLGTKYTADRWKALGSVINVQRIYSAEYGNTIRVHNSNAGLWEWIGQFIELPSFYAGKTVTLSYRIKYDKQSRDAFFWAKWKDGGSTILMQMGDKTIIGEWQHVESTFVVPTDAADISYFSLRWHGSDDTAGVEFDFTLAQVQFELGEVATSFEHRPYAAELQLCQRYYQELGTLWSMQYNATKSFIQQLLPVAMRVTPTFTYSISPTITLASNYSTSVKMAFYLNGISGSFSNTTCDAEIND